MRTIIEVPTPQLEQLDAHCARERISRAEAIRRAIDLLIGQQQGLGKDSPAFGLWAARKKRPADGLAYQRALREEWGTRFP